MKNKEKFYYIIKTLLVIALLAIGVKSLLNQSLAASSVVAVILGILAVKNYEIKQLRSKKD